MEIKTILERIYYGVGKQQYDFYVCGLRKKPDGSVCSTKWKKVSEAVFPVGIEEYWKLNWVNQRQVLPIEVILDLETKENLSWVEDTLNSWNVHYEMYDTGSRGVHIRIIFKQELSVDEKLAIIKYFGADEQKASDKTMIALEGVPHYKSNKIKEMIKWN